MSNTVIDFFHVYVVLLVQANPGFVHFYPWFGQVSGYQCFYGFRKLDLKFEDKKRKWHEADFGGWLPGHAITAVKLWLEAKRTSEQAEVLFASLFNEQLDALPTDVMLVNAQVAYHLLFCSTA